MKPLFPCPFLRGRKNTKETKSLKGALLKTYGYRFVKVYNFRYKYDFLVLQNS